MRRCVFVLGTRAQLVRIAPVLRLAEASGLRHTVWFTGQHHESIDDVISDFLLNSEFVVSERREERSSKLSLLAWVPRTLHDCWRYVGSVKLWTGKRPLVVVHGNTLSTWLGALAGKWGGGDIVHLESGLSSGKWNDPFPGEMLCRLTSRKARYAICPNDEAAARMERYPGCIVVNTREKTLLDCVRFAIQQGARQGGAGDHFVASIHRSRNIDRRDELARIVDEMLVAARFGEVHFILHPPTELRLKKYDLYDVLAEAPGVNLRPRMPYTDFLALIGAARAVFSDGGSNQEELSYLGVPAVLYRDRSERPDGLGSNVMLRGDVDEPMEALIGSGRIDALRVPSRIDADVHPSRDTVDALVRWVGGATGAQVEPKSTGN